MERARYLNDERGDRKQGSTAPGELLPNWMNVSEIWNQIDSSGTFQRDPRSGKTMQTTSNRSSMFTLSTALVASLGAGCAIDPAAPDDGLDEAAQASGGGTTGVTPVPSFASTPNIQQAAGLLANPSAIAVVRTMAGFQIYRCDQGTAGPEWKLRTPLATLEPSPHVQRASLNRARLGSLAAGYHYRSDFGGLLASSQLEALGLAQPPVNTPVWDFTFQPSGQPVHREVFAVRLLAQDAPSAANIPLLLLEVRGRAIDPGTPRAIAAATHILRWNTRGGLAPAASTCDATTLGRDAQSPYSADYFFLSTAP